MSRTTYRLFPFLVCFVALLGPANRARATLLLAEPSAVGLADRAMEPSLGPACLSSLSGGPDDFLAGPTDQVSSVAAAGSPASPGAQVSAGVSSLFSDGLPGGSLLRGALNFGLYLLVGITEVCTSQQPGHGPRALERLPELPVGILVGRSGIAGSPLIARLRGEDRVHPITPYLSGLFRPPRALAS